MRVYLPQVPEGLPASAYLRLMGDELTRALVPVVSTEQAVPHIRLLDPNGAVWKVTVSAAGVLTTVKEQGP